MADLWQITLNGGTVIRWHDSGAMGALSFNGHSYSTGPLIARGKISTKLGLEVATLDVTFTANASDLINGTPLIPFAQARGFDGASVVLYRAFLADWSVPYSIVGGVIAFSGIVTSIRDISRAGFSMTVSSGTVRLNPNTGEVYQAGCRNTHFDANCALNPAGFTFSGTVAAGAPTATAFNSNLSNASHYFDRGKVTFTSGANSGIQRTVQAYLNASGALSFAFGFPAAPAPGDTFSAVRGCLKSMADCTAQANLIHYRGEPFTPAAVTGALG